MRFISRATPVVTECIPQKNYFIFKFLMKLMIGWTHYVYIPSSFIFLGENTVGQKSLLRVGCRFKSRRIWTFLMKEDQ